MRFGCLIQSTLISVNKISMNLRQTFAAIGLVAGTALAIAAIPAQAAQLTASDLGLPSFSTLPSGAIGNGKSSAKSAFPYYTSQFTPAQTLRVKFSILTPTGLGSRGKGTSSFGYSTTSGFTSIFSEAKPYDQGSSAKTNDWLGTCGTTKAITGACEVTVTFEAGKSYQLGLRSKGISNYGVASLNQFTFDTASDEFYKNGTLAQPFTTVSAPGKLFIGMEDGEYATGQKYYYDYQDWVVKAEAAVPEPATLAGLGVVASGLLAARRRKASQSAEG